MNCQKCDECFDKRVGMLVCGCYVCASCYRSIKEQRINHCIFCGHVEMKRNVNMNYIPKKKSN